MPCHEITMPFSTFVGRGPGLRRALKPPCRSLRWKPRVEVHDSRAQMFYGESSYDEIERRPLKW